MSDAVVYTPEVVGPLCCAGGVRILRQWEGSRKGNPAIALLDLGNAWTSSL